MHVSVGAHTKSFNGILEAEPDRVGRSTLTAVIRNDGDATFRSFLPAFVRAQLCMLGKA